jgi:hypothetical protein
MVEISVHVDRRAALLLGNDLPPITRVTVAPDSIGADLWPLLVGMLDTVRNPPELSSSIKVAAATAEEVRAKMQDYAAERDRQHAVARERALQTLENYRTTLTKLREEVARPMTRVEKRNGYTNDAFVYQGFERELTVRHLGYADTTAMTEAEVKEINAILAEAKTLTAASQAEVKAANDAELARLQPEIEAHDAERRRLQDEAAAAKQAALQARFAERLETGYWERETGSYNPRRYKAPWCARVSAGASRGDLDYDFGDSTGRNGSDGLLRVACKPGDVIAHGQTDMRGKNTETTFLRMKSDGSMETISRTDAYKILVAATKKAG